MKDARELLIERRDALRAALAGDLRLLKTLQEQSGADTIDFALDSAQDEISSQLAEVESRELAAVEKALERIRGGSYGVCEGCSNPIPPVRLQALPYATSCIECQREIEKQHTIRKPQTARWGMLECSDDVRVDSREAFISG